jgi:hypothetical protein
LGNSHDQYLGNIPESNWRGSEKAKHSPQSGLFKPWYTNEKLGTILFTF